MLKGSKCSEATKNKMREKHKGKHHSETTKKKIGDSGKKAHKKYVFGFKKGHPYLRPEGFKHSEMSKKKMREKHKGKFFSEETKLKMKNRAQKAHEKKNYGFQKGHIMSIEEKRKKSIAWEGKNNPAWKGGRKKDRRRYVLIHKPKHPFATKAGYVSEQRLVVEKQIGRYLLPKEVVHHINKIRNDNRPENLIAFVSHSAHMKFHKNPDNVKSEEIIFNGKKLKK